MLDTLTSEGGLQGTLTSEEGLQGTLTSEWGLRGTFIQVRGVCKALCHNSEGSQRHFVIRDGRSRGTLSQVRGVYIRGT